MNDLMLRLKAVRVERGFTRKDFADAMGVNRISVGWWEKGACVPLMGTVAHIAEKLGLSVQELLGLPSPSQTDFSFPIVLKRARRKKGLTQQQLADKIGVSVLTISGYERRNHTPSWERFLKLSNALDIEVHELIGRGF